MKRNNIKFMALLIIALAIQTTITSSFSQVPQKLSYQAIIRNSSGQLVTDHLVGIKITLLQGSVSGTVVYTETQTPTTNANGLVSIEIGGGAGFNTINWVGSTYFIKTETDPTGGNSYTIAGTSQLMSVPYALHSKTAETVTGGITETDPVYTGSQAANITTNDITNLSNLSGTNTGDQNGSETKVTAGLNVIVNGEGTTLSPYVIDATTIGASHYIGELFGGGIVVAVWNISGVEHGLISSLTDVSMSSAWSNITSVEIGAAAGSVIDGQSNTNAIIAQPGHTASAAKLCDEYISGGFSDWYLPAAWELFECYNVVFVINKVLGANGFRLNAFYWSSSETGPEGATFKFFHNGLEFGDLKGNAYNVRAVRTF